MKRLIILTVALLSTLTHAQTHIEINPSTQTLHLIKNKKTLKTYPISTSKYGLGSTPGSKKTPTGNHIIATKIGEGAPIGTIFKHRINTQKIAPFPATPKEDQITTRILHLAGTDPHNQSSYARCIYIHATPEEQKIGQPASHGCIRMKNKDMIDLFNKVKKGTKVQIL